MITHGEILIHECDNSLPHDAHDWRWGFLWLRKGSCLGITRSQFDTLLELKWPRIEWYPGINHKHKMLLSRWWTTDEQLVFICDWHSAGCKFEYRISRGLWQRQTISGLRMRFARQAVAPLFQAMRERIEDE